MSLLLAMFPGRLWGYAAVAAVIFGLGGTSAWKVQAWRITNIKAEHALALADATERVNMAEKANQSKVIKAQNEATKLRQTNTANSVFARTELERLRSALSLRPTEDTLNACLQRADTRGKLLAQCGEELTDLARRADGHVADLKMIQEAWPQ